MSASRASRNRGGDGDGDNRFYCAPALRRLKEQRKEQERLQTIRNKSLKLRSKTYSSDADKRTESETSSTTKEVPSAPSSSISTPRASDLTNFDRFLEYTTPWVPAQLVSKLSMRAWRMRGHSPNPYFILGDLWESFGEWSAYGAGVPLVLNDIDSVVQYYVPYLSGIQLYIDPLKPTMKLRRPGEESDRDSSRDSSSDGSNEYNRESNGNNLQSGWSHHKRGTALTGSSSDESDVTNPPGVLTFEYFEQDSPYGREPLADKIVVLASMFPKLKTFRSCDLNPSSWVSVAWYPIYRIPTGPTLKNLDACFLTFHSLSTPMRSVSSISTELDNPSKLSLQTFGLASYKFKEDIWNSNGVHESQKFSSLLNAAGNWLRLLQVNHPDYTFFSSHNSQWR